VKFPPLKPYKWQQADIDRIVAGMTPDAGALVVSAPGAGKTIVAVESMKRLAPSTTLIIAPPSTHGSAWAKTLVRQGLTEPRQLIGTAKGKAAFEDLRWGIPGVYITSVQWFARQKWKGIVPDMVVFDEIHMAGRFGNVTQKNLNGVPGEHNGLQSPLRLALSGTPFRNNFENAWAVGRWVEPASMPQEYWVWRMKDCKRKADPFAPQGFRVVGELRPGEFVGRLTTYVIHHQRERCCDYHPMGFLSQVAAPIQVTRLLEMAPAQGRFYRSMEKMLHGILTTPDENDELPVVAELPIVARSMLRFCALGTPVINPDTEKLEFTDNTISPKLDQLIQDMEELDGKAVLILTHSKQFAKVAAKRVREAGYTVGEWTGDTTRTRRNGMLESFQAFELDAIVAVISAIGTGSDGLQEAAYNVIWLSISDDATDNVQALARLDRLGQTHGVISIEYRMLKTFDVGHLDKQIEDQLRLNASLRKRVA
jgi:hypothetical protein